MKKLIFFILILMLPNSYDCFTRDWYEIEESSSRDYICSMDKVITDEADGATYVKNNNISAVEITNLRIEQEQRSVNESIRGGSELSSVAAVAAKDSVGAGAAAVAAACPAQFDKEKVE